MNQRIKTYTLNHMYLFTSRSILLMQLPLRIRAFLFFSKKLQNLILRKSAFRISPPPQRTVVPTGGPRDPGGIDTLRGSLQAPLGDWRGGRLRTLTLPFVPLGPL